MRGRAPDPGRSVKAIKRDKQRHYAGLEYYGKTVDMTWFKRKPYDWTFYLDVFNNEIVGYDVRESMYGNGILNHKNALNYMLNEKIKRGYKRART